ncbi:hypothetical protein BpHYR1_045660 [Brachionus plicatilis]|uniref:Uncharacterized protein n=1 Tax=Brachionus plicatilis TaxID=10195 RepID=A0A3M7PIX8_BRAPC|nr:hypothetical protein BpHYR1_045660 [Brachionus plicatilis]
MNSENVKLNQPYTKILYHNLARLCTKPSRIDNTMGINYSSFILMIDHNHLKIISSCIVRRHFLNNFSLILTETKLDRKRDTFKIGMCANLIK